LGTATSSQLTITASQLRCHLLVQQTLLIRKGNVTPGPSSIDPDEDATARSISFLANTGGVAQYRSIDRR
ncbi:hypothetical protein Q5425_36050, partial [Amycolatopsis sp. A133]|uniref:hypothetical protein n=1 Tax=Amycolatopsis sp. A133 TaxID=3064472 RepID=UPI0027E777E6